MRFLHTADWQTGMKASNLGEAGASVRDERLVAAKRVVEAAKSNGVDFLLVAGDTFEDNGVDRGLVQRVADILDSSGGPVYIIPGNHDPLVPGSVWEHPAWKSAENLHLMIEETPTAIPGGVIYPCPLFEKNSGRDPTAWISSESMDKIRIGLAHGTVEGVRQDEPDYPIPRDAALRAGLDYLALGHWHSYATYPGPDGVVSMAYSGTHETTKFGERDSGNVLMVEISEPGTPPTITPIKTGGLSWITIQKEVRERGELVGVREEISALEDSDNTLIDVEVWGLLPADERGELDHIDDILNSRFLSGRLDASRLLPSPEDESWIENLPPGIIRDTAVQLRNSPGDSAEVAARALLELYAIAEEVSE